MNALTSIAVVVMTKYPAAGRVKTRLLPCLSGEQAADVHRAFLLHLLTRLTKLGPAELVICFDPPDAESAMNDWLIGAGLEKSEFRLLAQTPGDLGQRLSAAAKDVGRQHRRMLFLGVDSPDVPADHLTRAAELTAAGSICLGPTADGGYWCLGLSADVNGDALLAGTPAIPWSTGREARATLDRAASLNLPAVLAPAWDDVDYPRDLGALLLRLDQSPAPEDAALNRSLRLALPEPLLADLRRLAEH